MNDEQEKQQAQLENSPDADDMGAIKVADEVLSIVAGLAASEVNGVYGMSGGIREGLTDMLGKQNFSKGIKVYTEGHTVRVEVHVIITYGFNIPDVAIKLQEKVKEAVENMTGYEVTGVDVRFRRVLLLPCFPEELQSRHLPAILRVPQVVLPGWPFLQVLRLLLLPIFSPILLYRPSR